MTTPDTLREEPKPLQGLAGWLRGMASVSPDPTDRATKLRWADEVDASRASAPVAAPPMAAGQGDRTPQDFAIEHAEYMAKDGEQLLAAIEALSAAELQFEESDDENDDAVHDARDLVWEHVRAMRSGIYQFRQRRDRAALSTPGCGDGDAQGCNCRWRSEEVVQRCELHEAWHVAIHEWAARAKNAEHATAALFADVLKHLHDEELLPRNRLQGIAARIGNFKASRASTSTTTAAEGGNHG